MKRLLAAAFLVSLFAAGCQCSDKPDMAPVEGEETSVFAPPPADWA